MPDLPRVLTDAPDTDDPQRDRAGRRPDRPSARLRRVLTRGRHPQLVEDRRDLTEVDDPERVLGSAVSLTGRRRRLPAAVLTGALVITLTAGLLASTAQADDLTDKRDALKQQIAKTRSDLNESSAALSTAGVRVDEATNRLASARAELSQARSALADAKAEDARLAKKLEQAQADLAEAKAAVLDCQERLDAKKQLVGVMVRTAYQQQTNLMPIAVLTDPTTADLATRMQWATTMFDTTQSKIDELLALEAQLKATRARLATAEAKVADDRADAKDALTRTRQAEARARSAAAAVAGQLASRQAIERSAAKDVADDKAQYSQLTVERASVEQRIAVRIAKEKAAERAAAQAAAKRRAAEAAAAKRAAAQAKSSSKRVSRNSAPRVSTHSSSNRSSSHAASHASSSSSGSHHGFIYPVSAPITSPYGMRFHPVLHIWKLHDGTDFGAGCGTAMHAAYDGVVAEKYFNAGYGNRLMIDHGKVDGTFVTTGYNHAIRYVVGVGDHVKQGQVIGYVGTTGFSTGCHLHLMVWLNGKVVNPMTWY